MYKQVLTGTIHLLMHNYFDKYLLYLPNTNIKIVFV